MVGERGGWWVVSCGWWVVCGGGGRAVPCRVFFSRPPAGEGGLPFYKEIFIF